MTTFHIRPLVSDTIQHIMCTTQHILCTLAHIVERRIAGCFSGNVSEFLFLASDNCRGILLLTNPPPKTTGDPTFHYIGDGAQESLSGGCVSEIISAEYC